MTPTGLLLEMLTYMRPHGSGADREFRDRFIRPLGVTEDAHGNLHKVIGSSLVLWSCHTDTVHNFSGYQTVRYNPLTGFASLSKASRRAKVNCLGADDTAGVFILCQMIAAGVPGHYVFHYGEEPGGIGSSGLAIDSPELIEDCQIAIAFDRRGTSDVITHQYGGRTASEAFALSLAAQLNAADPAFTYAPAKGVFTDTANYDRLIPECTNLSVGYQDEHRSSESLNIPHVLRLLAAVSQINQSALVVKRDPADYSDYEYWPGLGWSAMAPIEQIAPKARLTHCPYCYVALEHDYCFRCGFDAWDSRDHESNVYLDPDQQAIQSALTKARNELSSDVMHGKRRSPKLGIVIPWSAGGKGKVN
jgi:hypothetical protein